MLRLLAEALVMDWPASTAIFGSVALICGTVITAVFKRSKPPEQNGNGTKYATQVQHQVLAERVTSIQGWLRDSVERTEKSITELKGDMREINDKLDRLPCGRQGCSAHEG